MQILYYTDLLGWLINDFDNLRNFIYNSSTENRMIIGDLNARIGDYENSPAYTLQDLMPFNTNRNSKDKTLNINCRL